MLSVSVQIDSAMAASISTSGIGPPNNAGRADQAAAGLLFNNVISADFGLRGPLPRADRMA